MSNSYNFDDLRLKFIELLDLVINNCTNLSNIEKIVKFREGIDDNDIKLLTNKFIKSVEKSKKLKKLLLNRNERVFSKKKRSYFITQY